MTKKEILYLIKTVKSNARGSLAKKFYKDPKALEIIYNITDFLDKTSNLSTRFYYIENDLNDYKKCRQCNTNVLNPRYNFCSSSCSNKFHGKDPNIVDKRRKKSIETFSKKSKDEWDKINNKIKETNLKKYGATYFLNSEEGIKKKKETWKKNLGADNPSKSKIVIEKRNNTNLKKYGSFCPLNGKEQVKKKKETWKKNLGVDNPSKSKKIIEQKKKNYKEKTGYEFPMQDPSSVNKFRETFFKNEKLGKHKKCNYKIYEFKSGRKIFVQGWEGNALDNYILNEYNENELDNSIKTMYKFKFKYMDPNKSRIYIPDFYIKKEKLFIEVKSKYFYDKNLDIIFFKARSVINKGYNFYLLKSNNGKKFKKITYEQIKADFEKSNKK